MPTTIGNPRDFVVELLGQILYVERRLHDAVLPSLAEAVTDEELLEVIRMHQEETRAHVERAEQAFRTLGVASTSNRTQAFEGAVSQHELLSSSFRNDRLANLFHALAALQTEHWEMAAYRALLALAGDEVGDLLRPSYDEEGEAAKLLVRAIDRLSDSR
jgi:ferritin-like metal-binding protein YciE